ncbi:MAG TPA: xanthine dehydrogenase family protein subunit M [Trebonia sp.]
MIPSPFSYAAPETLDEAVSILAGRDGDAKILAGGQSLLPLLKLRLADPGLLVDLRRIDALRGIQADDGGFQVGAMVTHAELGRAPDVTAAYPLIADAAADIGDPLVRNLGTFGGALAHADPTGDWPAVALALNARVHCSGIGGNREIPIDDFFTSMFTSALAPAEILVRVDLPEPGPGHTSAYKKASHPASGYSVAAVAVALDLAVDGTCDQARVALTAAGTTPCRARRSEELLEGRQLTGEVIGAAAASVTDGVDVLSDTYAPADYRAHLASVIAARAITAAVDRKLSA